jgi:hypothetical protein
MPAGPFHQVEAIFMLQDCRKGGTLSSCAIRTARGMSSSESESDAGLFVAKGPASAGPMAYLNVSS